MSTRLRDSGLIWRELGPSERYPGWQGSLFVGALRGQACARQHGAGPALCAVGPGARRGGQPAIPGAHRRGRRAGRRHQPRACQRRHGGGAIIVVGGVVVVEIEPMGSGWWVGAGVGDLVGGTLQEAKVRALELLEGST